ncbi:hypothetical protein OG792_07445 [Micromonospora sp. NBC_01699]|uniref:hypothetical protein n=1 Tax=Micromonospora sp. NBC_01699 TaxID=2975984 RepID=UPI002E3124BA|nr:hypothetical protein [Micromonospora sp. NBC_01699]
MIVPEIAGLAAVELDDLRYAVDNAIARLLSVAPDLLLVLGGGARTETLPAPYAGSFAAWGAGAGFRVGDRSTALGDRSTPLGDRSQRRIEALSLLVGGWLLSRHDLGTTEIGLDCVDGAAPTGDCAALGAALAERRPRVALLVLGDGSACRGEKAPGYDDPRAGAYDEGVAVALAGADPDALLDLDPVVSAELRVAGRAPWQVLAGAAGSGADWTGELTYHAAPYGVGYLVANWAREGRR